MPHDERGRPAGNGATQVTAGEAVPFTIPPDADWSTTYRAARRWVDQVARRRWPTFAANGQAWALSIAAWYRGGRPGSRR